MPSLRRMFPISIQSRDAFGEISPSIRRRTLSADAPGNFPVPADTLGRNCQKSKVWRVEKRVLPANWYSLSEA